MKRNNVLVKTKFFFCLILFLCSRCSDTAEGCLDVKATNFNVAADRACDDCCIYPNLLITLNHLFDSVSFRYNTELGINEIDTFRIANLKYFISNIRFTDEEGTTVATNSDSISLETTTDNVFVDLHDNFLLAKPGKFRDTIGVLKGAGSVSYLKFDFGLDDITKTVNPEMAPSGHALNISPDSLWTTDNGFLDSEIIFYRDTFPDMEADTVFWTGANEAAIEVEIPVNGQILTNVNISIDLNIYYKTWFSDINIKTDSNESIIEKIKMNIPSSFGLSN